MSVNLEILQVPFREFVSEVIANGRFFVALFGPNSAMEYFKERPELLPPDYK